MRGNRDLTPHHGGRIGSNDFCSCCCCCLAAIDGGIAARAVAPPTLKVVDVLLVAPNRSTTVAVAEYVPGTKGLQGGGVENWLPSEYRSW